MGVTVVKRIDFDKLKMHNEINIIASIIKKDITDGVNQGVDINGNPFKPLSPNTIAAKGHDKPLIDTGLMKKVYIKPRAKKGRPRASIIPPKGKNRTEIGGYHNEGTKPYKIVPKKKSGMLAFKTKDGMVYTKSVNHPGLPKREWFGISKRAEAKIKKQLALRLMEKLRQPTKVIKK